MLFQIIFYLYFINYTRKILIFIKMKDNSQHRSVFFDIHMSYPQLSNNCMRHKFVVNNFAIPFDSFFFGNSYYRKRVLSVSKRGSIIRSEDKTCT